MRTMGEGSGGISFTDELPRCAIGGHQLCGDDFKQSLAIRSSEVVDMESVMAEELRGVCHLEREQAYEELHGVFGGRPEASTFQETPDLVDTSLTLLKLELDRIPMRKKRAYNRALFLKPSLEDDRAFALMFLRADRFEVPAAAQRICRFFEDKLLLFGEAKLVSKLTLDDLSEDDIAALRSGVGHLLPHKDRSGRRLFFVDYRFIDYKDWKNMNRWLWYLAMSLVEDDEEVQKRGIVEVFFAIEAIREKLKITDYTVKGTASLLSLPIRIAGFHFCYNNSALTPVVRLVLMAFGASNRLRFRAHFGSALEARYALIPYGIVLPTELFNRNVSFKQALVNAFFARCQSLEHSSTRSTNRFDLKVVSQPESHDILLGKGRPCQDFSGNLTMNRMVNDNYDDYRQQDKSGKAQIVNSILEEIRFRQGLFLERVEKIGWSVVREERVLRNKITQAFRVRNRGSFGAHRACISLDKDVEAEATDQKRVKVSDGK